MSKNTIGSTTTEPPLHWIGAPLARTRWIAVAGGCFSVAIAGSILGGCAVAEPETERPAAETPVRLPTIRLSSRPAVPVNSVTENQLDKTVTVSGEITQKAAMLDGWLYQLQDESGSVWVLGQTEPDLGDLATVEGAVRYEAIVVGEVDAGEFYLEEESYQREGNRPAEG